MTQITPSRQGQKLVQNLQTDAQWAQQYGYGVFQFSGDSEDAYYKSSCTALQQTLSDLSQEIIDTARLIPVTGSALAQKLEEDQKEVKNGKN